MSIWGALLVAGIILWFGSELPDIETLTRMTRRPSITLLDKKKNVLASYGDLYGEPISAKDLPSHVIHALLAIEDRRFYSHWGVDPWGILRALWQNFRHKKVVQGGSTITQQLAKNFLQSKKIFTHRDRSFRRKVMEAILAWRIEKRFTKDQILTMHLNRVYMGSGTWGVDAAAQKYFGCSAKKLNLYESAILMGLLKGPSYYSPLGNHSRSEGRAKQVLQAMVEAGFISQPAAIAAIALPTPLATGVRRNSARYFTDWAMDQLYALVDTNSEDLIVTTTLDATFQNIGEHYAKTIIEQRAPLSGVKQIALVCLNKNGAVQAMIGGVDYQKSPFNRVTKALRQPGSAFKYFVYLTALERGYTPSYRIHDGPINLGGWKPKNYLYKSQGNISLRTAFAKSVNTVSARLMSYVGVRSVIKMARKLGITSHLDANYSLALGTSGVTLLELTSAFGVLLTDGYPMKPYAIETVKNRAGDVLYQHKTDDDEEEDKEQVVSEESLSEMKQMLEAVITDGTGRHAQIPQEKIMGKTGTSNKGAKDRDALFVALVRQWVTGVWSGCDDEAGMTPIPGGSASLHLWKAFTLGILEYMKNPQDSQWEEEDLSKILPPYACTPDQKALDAFKALKEEEEEERAAILKEEVGETEQEDTGNQEDVEEEGEEGEEEDNEGEDQEHQGDNIEREFQNNQEDRETKEDDDTEENEEEEPKG